MSKSGFLRQYRDKRFELETLRQELSSLELTGRPRGMTSTRYGFIPRGTNDTTAAAIQRSDGLTAAMDRVKAELSLMDDRFEALIASVPDYRTRLVLRHYYALLETDEEISESLHLCPRHVNRIRNAYLKQAG